MKLALSKTKLPKLLIKSDDEGQIEIDFSDNTSDLVVLKTEEVPYATTINKIGQYYVVDADLKGYFKIFLVNDYQILTNNFKKRGDSY